MNPPAKRYLPIIILLLLTLAVEACAKDKDDSTSLVLGRMFSYCESIDSTIEGHSTTAYLKYRIKTDQENVFLFCVPHLYVLARSKYKSKLGEIYATLTFHEKEENEVNVHFKNSTVRRHRTVMTNILCYLTPNIYAPTLISDHLLSPFNKKNKHYYKYKLTEQNTEQVQLAFRPRWHNTQAVKGHAIIDLQTGRITQCTLAGEYDMVSFEIHLVMGDDGVASLLPSESKMKTKFSFMGNRIRGIYHAKYDMPAFPADSIVPREQARQAIDDIRPYPLDDEENAIYAAYDSINMSHAKDTTTIEKAEEKDFVKDILWDAVGENLFQRLKWNFGTNDRGYLKLSPIINPLYVSYSQSKGLSYRMTLRAGYDINSNSDLYMRAKVGYSFRQRQPYIDLPIIYTFNKEKNGFIKAQWRNGERVTSSTVVDKIKNEIIDSIDWDKMNLDYFRHLRLTLEASYDINKYLGFQTGVAFNRWTSIHDKDFNLVKKPTVYSKTAWTGEVTLRPIGPKGPIFTINYETTFRGTTEPGLNYEKWEFDCSYLRMLPCMRSLSMRIGAGVYPTSTYNAYFLDFNNFREDNIPGGWNDEWSGEFELLHSNWYNSSNFYLRANATYESPMLFLSRVPLVGTVIEKERVYLSALRLSQLKNYFELGYGITNRVFSFGLFTSFVEGRYQSLGCQVGFELFNRW